MKFCPKCQCDYLDEAVSCGDCNAALFDYPDIASGELSLEIMINNYKTEFAHPFYPVDGFYDNWQNPILRLQQMGKQLCNWLKLDSNRVIIEYDSSLSDIPGRFSHRLPIRHIGINPKYSMSPFKVGAILAHELAHFYMSEHQQGSPDTLTNELQTDLTLLCAGFGILYINAMKDIELGISAEKLIWTHEEANRQEWVGYFRPDLFCYLFSVYLKKIGLSGKDVIGYIHPDSRAFLPDQIRNSKSSNPTKIILGLEENYRRNTFVAYLVMVLLLLFYLLRYIHL